MSESAAANGGLPSAAWYPDPQSPGNLRWWDGQRWTEHVSPSAASTSKSAQPPDWAPFALTLLGAALALLGMILPTVGSVNGISDLSGLEGNSMISQTTLSLLIIPAAILAGWRAWENQSNPGGTDAGAIGAGIGIALLVFREAASEVQVNGVVVDTEPGLGIFTAGAGAALIILGALWQRAARS